LTSWLKLTSRGIYRTLREIIEDSEAPAGSGHFYFANPGRSPLDEFPHPKREYLAFELSVETSSNKSFNILVSYILSHNSGNYAGMFWQDYGVALPVTGQFDYLDIMNNTTGLLPNDRTHMFKVNDLSIYLGLSCEFPLSGNQAHR
jgi:hypothetical protein